MIMKMKKLKIWHAFLMLALIVVVSVSCNKDEELVLDFDITVPDNWTYYVLANEGYVYSAERNKVNDQDTIREYLSIYKEPLEGYNLSTYYGAVKANLLALDNYVSTLQEKDTTINGASSKRIIYRETGMYINSLRDTSDVNLITTLYFFFEKNNGYNLGFVSVDTTYYKTRPVFDDIIATFQFKN